MLSSCVFIKRLKGGRCGQILLQHRREVKQDSPHPSMCAGKKRKEVSTFLGNSGALSDLIGGEASCDGGGVSPEVAADLFRGPRL
jgi:hypothetical protein